MALLPCRMICLATSRRWKIFSAGIHAFCPGDYVRVYLYGLMMSLPPKEESIEDVGRLGMERNRC